MMTAAQARQRARELREQALTQVSARLRYELRQIADQYDLLAAELDRFQGDANSGTDR